MLERQINAKRKIVGDSSLANSGWAPGRRLIASLTGLTLDAGLSVALPAAAADVGAGWRKQLGVSGDLFVNVVL